MFADENGDVAVLEPEQETPTPIEKLRSRVAGLEEDNRRLRGQHVRSVERRAKYLLLRFDCGTLIMHLGMSGNLRVLPFVTWPLVRSKLLAFAIGASTAGLGGVLYASKVTIISHDLWKRNFAGASDILGRSVRLNGKPATVIGVAEARFHGGRPGDDALVLKNRHINRPA